MTDRESIEQTVIENGGYVLGTHQTRRPLYRLRDNLMLQAEYDDNDKLVGCTRIWTTDLGDDLYWVNRYIKDAHRTSGRRGA